MTTEKMLRKLKRGRKMVLLQGSGYSEKTIITILRHNARGHSYGIYYYWTGKDIYEATLEQAVEAWEKAFK